MNSDNRDILIDYKSLIKQAALQKCDEIELYLKEELPYLWFEKYRILHQHSANVCRIQSRGYEYIYDNPKELIRKGLIDPQFANEDRLVGVHGNSQPKKELRDKTYQRNFPMGYKKYANIEGYDRGHFIAHSIGGELGMNIFGQPTKINRGWSKEGRLFRSMERYCQKNINTYFFIRPVYSGRSAQPALIEFGILKKDGTLWSNLFNNTVNKNDLTIIEDYIDKIDKQDNL